MVAHTWALRVPRQASYELSTCFRRDATRVKRSNRRERSTLDRLLFHNYDFSPMVFSALFTRLTRQLCEHVFNCVPWKPADPDVARLGRIPETVRYKSLEFRGKTRARKYSALAWADGRTVARTRLGSGCTVHGNDVSVFRESASSSDEKKGLSVKTRVDLLVNEDRGAFVKGARKSQGEKSFTMKNALLLSLRATRGSSLRFWILLLKRLNRRCHCSSHTRCHSSPRVQSCT